MKVTDEMVEKLRAVLIERMDKPPGRVASRAALENAVGDVPEPTSHLELENLVRIADQHQDRANEAEAKLATWMRLADEHMAVKNEATARVRELEAKLADETARASELEAQLEEVHMWYDAFREAEAMLPELGQILEKR